MQPTRDFGESFKKPAVSQGCSIKHSYPTLNTHVQDDCPPGWGFFKLFTFRTNVLKPTSTAT